MSEQKYNKKTSSPNIEAGKINSIPYKQIFSALKATRSILTDWPALFEECSLICIHFDPLL